MPNAALGRPITKDRYGNRGVEVDARNYELGNDPNGLAKATSYLAQQNAQDQARTGPDMSQNLWGQQANSLGQVGQQSRSQEDMLANALQAQALGYGYNPAIAQLDASTRQAQGLQQSIAHGSSGYDLAAANREAAWQNGALAGQAGQQRRVMDAQMQQFGRDNYAGLADAMRGQDLANRDALQQNAIRQAQLTDQQRTANDSLAQWYLGEQDRLRRAQTGANINYESQDAANKLGVSNQNFNRQSFDQGMTNKYEGMALGMAGAGYAAGTSYADAQKRQKRNPYDPGDT